MHRTRLVLPAALVAALALGPSPAVGGKLRVGVAREARHRSPVGARAETRTIQLASGAAVKRFEFSEPSGAIRLLRVTVPRGTRARLTGLIPGAAGVSTSVPRGENDPAETCRRSGATVVCTQSEEACPMPRATWRFRLNKLAGPAGDVRVQFVVGH